MRKIILLFVSLILMVILFGCSSTGQMVKPNKNTEVRERKTGIINENFDLSVLDENELDLKKTISPESKSDNIDDLLLQTPDEQPLPEEVDGFRIQICAVSDEEKAKQVQRDAIFQFINEEVYLDYHAPYYKVRIGNCLTRYEAEQLQQTVIKQGFADAWVVRAKVKPNSDPPVQNEESPPNLDKPE
ncbi:SPOR domain-containing protein [candidate division KSB1 bacterium]|nr:SPOR domain-containing protein [candidate division KSB1 bacterium]MBL7092976.1 SPOR domain-containing protein [candidate division KSB1 bacterium]